jgi:Alcohol dehydrogenase transcription factor Myb/SANT-like
MLAAPFCQKYLLALEQCKQKWHQRVKKIVNSQPFLKFEIAIYLWAYNITHQIITVPPKLIYNFISVPDVKTRWRSLRDRFTREKKAAILSSSPDYAGKPFKPWPLVEHMNFLWSFISHREGYVSNKFIHEWIQIHYFKMSQEC